MSDVNDLASSLFGTSRAEVASGGTSTLYGTAATDSSGGSVSVRMGADTLRADGQAGTSVLVPTTTDVRAGETVIVTVVDGHPVVTGVVGSGDRLRTDVDAAAGVADLAQRDVTKAQADIDQFKKDAEATYSTKTETDEKTNAVKETIEATYLKKDDASTTYATKTELTKSADGIKAEVAEEYVTKADASETYVGKSTFEQDARAIATTVTSELTTGWTAWADDSTGKNMVLGDMYPSSATDPSDASHPLDVDGMAFRGSAKVLSKSQPTDAKSYDWVPNPTAAMRSEVRQTADAITSTVAAGYATKGEVSEVSTRVSQTADKVDSAITDVNGLSTLIREDSSGITVGKSTDGTTYSSGRTRVADDGMYVMDASGNVLAYFGSKLVELGNTSLDAVISMLKGVLKIDVTKVNPPIAGGSQYSINQVRLTMPSAVAVANRTIFQIAGRDDAGNVGSGLQMMFSTSGKDGSLLTDVWLDGTLAVNERSLGAVHSLYNPNNGQYMYTGSASEISSLTSLGWTDEGTKFMAFI